MWLLKEERARALAAAYRAGFRITDAQAASLGAMVQAARDRTYSVNGEVAEIRIEGVLTKAPSIFMLLFGGGNTAYADIITGLEAAAIDPAVKRAVLHIDSPGGSVDGLFDTLASLEAFAKPLTARAVEACSAAYAIASTASKLEATNNASEFGSIGVAATFFVWDDEVTVTSTEAPEKRPDVRTPEGKASVQRYLDAIHELFVDVIARGRKTTVANVNSNFGRGGVLLAEEAKRRGMLDMIAKPKLRVVRAESDLVPTEIPAQPTADADKPIQADPAGSGESKTMKTLAELKAQHPDLCDQLVAETLKKERERIEAHVTLGRQSGDEKTMFEALVAGTEMTVAVQSKYVAASMNRAEQDKRQQEADEAGKAADGTAANGEQQKDMGDLVVERLKAKRTVGARTTLQSSPREERK